MMTTPRRTHLKPTPILLGMLTLAFALAGCNTDTPVSRKVMLLAEGGIGANTGVNAAGIASEQVTGYQRYLEGGSAALDVFYADESMADKDLQRTLRDEVQSADQPLMAMIGGTSNAASAHGAALVNFFNVPLIIPSAYGDNLFPVGNQWAFRLSPPSSAYASALFSGYLTKTEIQAIRTKITDPLNPAPVFNVGILYEQNTFGEAAAVSTVKAANTQELRVGLYQRFDVKSVDAAGLRAIVEATLEADTQVVYLISSDPGVSMNLAKMFADVYAKGVAPILIGQGGGFSSAEFMASDAANGVYVLRQVVDRTSCPVDVKSEYEAQSYAAMSLLQYAFQVSEEKMVTQSGLLGFLNPDKPTVGEKRESLRDAIKVADIALPCLGKVAFDNNGQNALARIELVKLENNVWVNVDQATLLDEISNLMFERMFE